MSHETNVPTDFLEGTSYSAKDRASVRTDGDVLITTTPVDAVNDLLTYGQYQTIARETPEASFVLPLRGLGVLYGQVKNIDTIDTTRGHIVKGNLLDPVSREDTPVTAHVLRPGIAKRIVRKVMHNQDKPVEVAVFPVVQV